MYSCMDRIIRQMGKKHLYRKEKDRLKAYFKSLGANVTFKKRATLNKPSKYDLGIVGSKAFPQQFMALAPPVKISKTDSSGMPILLSAEIDNLAAFIAPHVVTPPRPKTDDNCRLAINSNKALGSIELEFTCRPSDAILKNVRESGFRWSPANKVWYAKSSEKTKKFAESLQAQIGSKPPAKPQPSPKEVPTIKTTPAFGRKITLSLPNGERRSSQFVIVELDSITASHNEKTFSTSKGYPTNDAGENINDRNYSNDPNAQAKVQEVAQRLDPAKVVTTSRGVDGTPIITKDNIVVSGNNRTMGLKLAYSDFPASWQEYTKFLSEEVNAFGFEDMAFDEFREVWKVKTKKESLDFKKPVLVRIDYDFPEYTTTELSKYNRSEMKSERPVDKAIRLSNSLREQFRCYWSISENIGQFNTLSEFYASRRAEKEVLEYLKNCNVITDNDVAAIYDPGSGFNSAGKELLESVLSAIVLDKEALLAANMDGVKKYRQLIVSTLPILSKHASLDKNYIKPLNEAVVLQKKIQSSGLSFKEFISQLGMFEAPPSREAMILNRLMDKGRKAFKTAFAKYNDTYEVNQKPSLFGEQKSAEEIFNFFVVEQVDKDDLDKINLASNFQGVADKKKQVDKERERLRLKAKAEIELLEIIKIEI